MKLATFASEVTRVAHEVGTLGNLGVTARVDDVEGTWSEITSNVNTMATNLTSQVSFVFSFSFFPFTNFE